MIQYINWRGAREAYWPGLENLGPFWEREFESRPLRRIQTLAKSITPTYIQVPKIV